MSTDLPDPADGRALLAAATPGPWRAGGSAMAEKFPDGSWPQWGLTIGRFVIRDMPTPADAELIVWMRNNLPALLDKLDALGDVRALADRDRHDGDCPACGCSLPITGNDIRAALEEKP